ncbi:MAG: MurR/RpiR family transcriptional regulator [Peptostreptococcaceae bacterium]
MNNFQDGKELINNIKSQYRKLSKGQKIIAQYILENYDKVAFMTVSKLSEEVGVSESTVVRFASALGYSGYPKLQEALEELVKNKLTSVQRVDLIEENSSSDILENVLKSDIKNIKETLDNIDENAFEESVDKLIKAKRVYIFGMRSSYTIAQYLGFYLDRVLDNVQVIKMEMGDSLDQIVRIDEEDVLIVISFPRYSKNALQTAMYAKEKKAHIISLTDSLFAPISSISDNLLLVKNNMISFVDSLVPALSIVNSLVISISAKKKEQVKSHFEDLEKIWQQNSVYE